MASCAICDNPALFRCGKCKLERYCSRECQKDHWPHHKTRCAQLSAASKAAADKEASASAPAAAEGRESASSPGVGLQPQPPPSQIQPQPPLQLRAPERPGSFRANPRSARLLGETPPSLQPESAAIAVTGGSASPEGHDGSGSNGSGGGVGVGGDGSASSLPSLPRPQPPPPLAPRPPSFALPSPPPGSGPHLSGRSRLMRVHLRDMAAASAGGGGGGGGGGLQVDGCGLVSRSGSILDRIMPPPQPPQPLQPPQQPSPAAAAVDTAAGAGARAGATPAAAAATAGPESAPQPWPWAPLFASKAPAGSSSASATSLPDLPAEVQLEVLKVLPARSLAAAASVCRSWRRAAREPWLWVRQMCAAGYPLPAAAYVAQQLLGGGAASAAADGVGVADAETDSATSPTGAALAVAGVRGIRAVRAVRAAGGSSHEDFMGGLRAGFLDRLQEQAQQGPGLGLRTHPLTPQRQQPQQQQLQHPQQQQVAADLKGLYGRTVRMESNWRSARYAESMLREHSSNVECLAFQRVDPWGSVLLSAAWDGSVRVFSLGPPGGSPQQARCVRRYRGHTGWITCMAAGRHQVVTASTDRRVAAWRYYSESSDPWVALEHPQEVTLVRFCYAPPPPPTTHYLSHYIYRDKDDVTAGGAAASDGGAHPAAPPQTLTGPTGAAAAAAGRPCGHNNAHSCAYGSQQSREALSLRCPYDPQWEDWVVTGCIDGVIRLWHLPSKQMLRVFSGHSDVVWGISVMEASSVMVSSSRDGTARLWQLPPYDQMQAAVAPPPPGGGGGGAGGNGGGEHGQDGGGSVAAGQPYDAIATLCGHSSAILCMDVHRVPPGLVAAAAGGAAAAAAAGVHDGGAVVTAAAADVAGVRARPDEAPAAHTDMVAVLAHLLNTSLIDAPVPGQAAATRDHKRDFVGLGSGGGGAAGGGGAELAGVSSADKAAGGAAGAAGALPVWLVATGGADAVVRVWNLATAQCLSTLRGHSVGVLSVQFGYLPLAADAQRDRLILPADLDVSAVAPPPPLALPPGQYGAGCAADTPGGSGYGGGGGRRPQLLPASQRLVLVTGSVREVRVWDPVAGTALAQLGDHSGPVTSIALVHGMVVTLAMNDGLIVYKCNGLDGGTGANTGGGDAAGGGDGIDLRDDGGGGGDGTPGDGSAGAAPGGGGGATARLRQGVAAHLSPLETVICMQDSPHHSFAAALAVQVEGLAVGSGTGDITYLDFRPRASPLPLPTGRRQQQQQPPRPQEGEGRQGAASAFVLRF